MEKKSLPPASGHRTIIANISLLLKKERRKMVKYISHLQLVLKPIWTKLILIIYIIFSFLLTGCRNHPLAKVGMAYIYNKDFEDRLRIEKVYRRKDTVDSIGVFLLLIQKFIDVEIARKMGIEITKTKLIKEAERINRETKEKELLSIIKESFGEDNKRYLKSFVLPVLARRLVEEKFWYDTLTYQKRKYRKAKMYLKFMREKKVKVDTVRDYFEIECLKSKQVLSNSFFYFLKQKADSVGIDDGIFKKVIQDKNNFYCIKEKKKGKSISFEGIRVKKEEFNKFYKQQLKTIGIKIYNNKIKGKIAYKIKGTYWEKYIK